MISGGARAAGIAETTLPSGARVVTEPVPGVRSVTVGLWLPCGSRDERTQVAGATHFLEHLLFKGTRRRSAQDIAEEIEAVGGEMNAFTGKEYTCYYVRCLDQDLPLAVDVLGDMATAARLRSADCEAERDVILEEIRLHLDTPDDLVQSVFAEAHFGDHPLGREVLGSEGSIRAMSREQIARYYRRHYVAPRIVVAVAGNIAHEQVVELVGAALGERNGEGGQLRRQAPAPPAEPTVAVRTRPTEQAHVVLGARGMTRGDPQRFAGSVANHALGGGSASRLFQEVRERRGLVYTVFSHLGMHVDSGDFSVYAGTGPERVTDVLDVVRRELDRFREVGLTDEELERAKSALAGGLVLAMEDTGSRMLRLGKSVVTDTPLLSLDETLAAVEAVTHEDVCAVTARLLAGPYTLALVGPFDGEGVPPALERYVAPAA